MKIDTDSLKVNISWAAWHLLGSKYQRKYEAKQLTYSELNELCQSFDKHRTNMSKQRLWYEFRLKRSDKRVLKDLNVLLKNIYNAQIWGHKHDLSQYGGPDNTK